MIVSNADIPQSRLAMFDPIANEGIAE